MGKKLVGEKKTSNKDLNMLIRVVLSVVVAILGFNFSRSAFFKEYPLFGVEYLAEVAILVVAGLVGFFALPKLLLQVRDWFEGLVAKVISDMVSRFWDQQSKRIQAARREKQLRKAQEEKDKIKEYEKDAILIDTSVLVDGRILDIVKTGFLSSTLVVPQNVIEELQLIADSKDKLKRQRGRRGLDVVKKLKKAAKVVCPEIKGRKKGVDKTLVSFAKDKDMRLMTLDFNLNKVADVLGIKVLNINGLVNALKTVLLPGEELEVEIVQEGQEKKQGVGYLSDGTMLVVAGARDKVGDKVVVKVKKVIQSSAGKMIFCEVLK